MLAPHADAGWGLAAPLLVQLLAEMLGNAVEEDTSAWAPVPALESHLGSSRLLVLVWPMLAILTI